MKFQVLNNEKLQFFNDTGELTGEIFLSASGDMLITPTSASGDLILGNNDVVGSVEIGNVNIPSTLNLLGGGTITSNGNTLTIGDVAAGDSVIVNGPITASNILSASYALTASHALNSSGGGGSGIFEATGSIFATTNVLEVTGSMTLINTASNSTSSNTLSIEGSGSVSGSGIFDVRGSVGQLFEVADGLDGVLMSVNDISGIPILTVSSSGDVILAEGSTLQGTAATASFVAGVSAAFPFTGSAGLLGSLDITGSGDDIFKVRSQSGSLFSVDDGLDGILMSVNDISGLPLFEISSSGDVELIEGNISASAASTASFGQVRSNSVSINDSLHNIIISTNGSGSSNTGVVTGDHNIVIGMNAAEDLGASSDNVIIGNRAASGSVFSSTRENNVIIGTEAGSDADMVDGANVVYIGYRAGYETTGYGAIHIGANAGQHADGNGNVSVGQNSMMGHATYGGTPLYNVVIGYNAGQQFWDGNNNVAIGSYAMANTAQHYNTSTGTVAVGSGAIRNNRKNNYTTAIGFNSLYALKGNDTNAGNYITAVGAYAGYTEEYGYDHTLIGYKAGYNLTASTGSIVIGYDAASGRSYMNKELFIGSGSTPLISASLSTGHIILSPTSSEGHSIGGLEVHGSGSNVFEVIGTEGTLFAIDDSLSGSLFAVTNKTGIPRFEVFSDGKIEKQGNNIQDESFTWFMA